MLSILKSIKFELRSLHSVYGLNLLFSPEDSKNHAMNNFKKINTVFGWITFLIAIAVYIMTLEQSVSLWDCGEFISASYRLQVVHPPGAPLF